MEVNGFGVYIHVPFCKSKCAYCDFYSLPDSTLRGEYAEAIAREWNLRRGGYDGEIKTVYFGGGTPSCLPDVVLADMLGLFDCRGEKTIEVNPDDVTAERAQRWLEMGFNRVSMGVQSLDDRCLRCVGRRHTATQAKEAYLRLRSAGFDNVSLDLIYGLPAQDFQSWKASVDSILALKPEHLSAYLLSYEEGTPLTKMRETGELQEASDDLVEEMYRYLCESAGATGYEHYEISNFALPGRQSRHNSSYWDGTPYLGLGPGAHSYNAKRFYNPNSLERYLEEIKAGKVAAVEDEETETDKVNDIIFTALRTSAGLDLNRLPLKFRQKVVKSLGHIPSASLICEGARIRIPEGKFLVSDAIIRELMID